MSHGPLMFRRAASLALVAAALTLGACAPISTYSGFQAVESNPKDVKIGVDTKSTVRGRLGTPSAISTFDPNVWFYVNQVKQTVAFRRARVTARDVVAVSFNKETEVAESVNTYSLKDGKVIAFNGRETPTRGREMTILEQLLGSVGRGSLLPNQDDDTPGNRPGDRR